MIGFLLAVLTIALIWLIDSPIEAKNEFIVKSASTIAVLLLFPVVYGWKFFSCQPKMAAEARGRLDAAKAENEKLEKQNRERAIDRITYLTLSVLWETGLDLASRRIAADGFAAWQKEVHEWGVLSVSFLASKFSHQDAVGFKVAKHHRREKFHFAVNAEHNDLIIQVLVRCDALRDILSRRIEAWSSINTVERAQIMLYLEGLKRIAQLRR